MPAPPFRGASPALMGVRPEPETIGNPAAAMGQLGASPFGSLGPEDNKGVRRPTGLLAVRVPLLPNPLGVT